MGVYVIIGFLISIPLTGFIYTILDAILDRLPPGPGTPTMAFLQFVASYMIALFLLILIFWYLNSMQKSKYQEVYFGA